MDWPFEDKCPLGLDFDDGKIKAQLGFVHLVVSRLLKAEIPAQGILELYLLTTFRANSSFVHEISTPELEMHALHDYLNARIEYIGDFLEVTNANILQTNREA